MYNVSKMEDNITDMLDTNDLSVNVKIGLAMLVPEWCRNGLIIFMVVVLIAGLPGNIFVILVQINTKDKTTTDWFVTFLAISDVLSLVVNIPIYIIIVADKWQNVGSQFGCKFHHFVIAFTFITQTIIVACNAVDRLWKSVYVHQIFTPKKAIYSGVMSFAFSTLVGTITTFTAGNNILGQCILDPSKKFLQLIVYLIILTVVAISSLAIVVSYTRILMIVRARNRVEVVSNISGNLPQNTGRTEARYKKALQTTKLMFIVTVVFIITTIIPNVAIIILSRAECRKSFTGSILVFLLTRMYLINNCANPYIYFCLNASFRRKIINALKNGSF